MSNVSFYQLSNGVNYKFSYTAKVGKSLGAISPKGITRSTFLMNPEGKIKLAEYHENGIGRDAGELFRKVKLIVEAYN